MLFRLASFVLATILASLTADTKFEAFHEHDGVRIELGRVEKGPPWVRGTFEVPAAAEKVDRVLANFTQYDKLFDNIIKKLEVLDSSPNGARLRLVWDYPWPYRNRYGIGVYVNKKRSDGSFLLSWQDDSRASDKKYKEKRIRHVSGQTEILPLSESRCRVIYTYQGDLGAKFPASIKRRTWREQPVNYRNTIFKALGLTV